MGWGCRDGLVDALRSAFPDLDPFAGGHDKGANHEERTTMTIAYTNRTGKRYILHVGKTKGGRDKFFMSTKAQGTLAEAMPAGFEIVENPDALVFLRKILISRIHREDLDAIDVILAKQAHLKPYQTIVDRDKDAITIHLLDSDPAELLNILAPALARSEQGRAEYARRFGTYTAMLRFSLSDEDRRLFTAERFCFRGRIDDWIYLDGPGELEPLARKYLKHLGKESFFELM
jgi:hypothetical protein